MHNLILLRNGIMDIILDNIKYIMLTALYIIFLIYSRYQDHKDAEKLGISALVYNQSAAKYFYQVLVFTGIRKNSQTNAKVRLIYFD